MKFLKSIAVVTLAFSSLISFAHAKGNLFYTVPFYNVSIDSGSKIYVDYKFDSHKRTLVCKTDSAALSSVKWTYKDVTYKNMLPVTLIDDLHFQGQLADPNGKLTITNEFGPDNMLVSCEYRDMN